MSRKSEDSVTVPFFKEKGRDIHDCDDYRGIMMTSHTVNVCGRVIASWGVTLCAEKFGFNQTRIREAIFAARQLMERHRRSRMNYT